MSDFPSSEKHQAADSAVEERRKDFGIIPIPDWLRYDPEKPFHFGMFLNILFGVTSTFSTYIVLFILCSAF